MSEIFLKIQNRRARVAVVGLGAVGLPLCAEIVKAGFTVVGIDLSLERLAKLRTGQDRPFNLSKEDLLRWLKEKRLLLSHDFSDLSSCDVICLAVPTSLTPQKEPDLSCLYEALTHIRQHLRTGQALWIESTLYPGATDEVVQPFLEISGFRAGRDFYLAVSPERLDPGRAHFSLPEIPKLVGGVNSASTEACSSFYRTFIRKVIPLTSTRAAEAAKCFENAFRFVNIALVNEFALAASSLKVDPWEVLEAAATKPFGFMPFSPGPGVGGASLPAASHFLQWKVEQEGDLSRRSVVSLIEAAETVHALMGKRVVEKIEEGLKRSGKTLHGSRVILLGVAYKEDLSDTRHSPAIGVMEILLKGGSDLSYWDPHAPSLLAGGRRFISLKNPDLSAFDAVVLITPHHCFDLASVAKESKLLIDPRNAARAFPEYKHKILRL